MTENAPVEDVRPHRASPPLAGHVLVADDMPANVELLRRLLTARIHGRDWRGRPLVNYETVVNLIGATKTRTGLRVKAVLDTGTYQKGLKVNEEAMREVQLRTR